MKISSPETSLVDKENQQVELLISGTVSIKNFVAGARAECTKIENKHKKLTTTLETGDLGQAIDQLEQFHDQVDSLKSRTQNFIWHLSNLIEEVI
jgi:hypothetical protein